MSNQKAMLLKFRIWFFIFILTGLPGCSPDPEGLQTPLEKSAFSAYTGNRQLLEFLSSLGGLGAGIEVDFYTVSGKSMPVVSIAAEKQGDQRLDVMMLAQLHGNEPSGMEGLLLLIRDFANGKHSHLLDSMNLIILPQCNPWGADHHVRRNESDIDLNRDQLLLSAEESGIIQQIFDKYRPHMTVDFHEYYPFGRSWMDFGYRRNFDIQLGGPTNINIDTTLRELFDVKALPYVKSELEKQGYSFFEYTLGNFALGERLRHSTVDVNDGRQSFGIAGTFSMIVEGMIGLDSLDRIEHRAKSQHATALALLKLAWNHKGLIQNRVKQARENLLSGAEPVSIRQEHFRGENPLHYPLLSVRTGNDTVFIVEEYHPVIKSLLDVDSPKGYLIPKTDSLLAAWLQRSNLYFTEEIAESAEIFTYRIKALNRRTDEELENYFPVVDKIAFEQETIHSYYYVPLNQIYKHKIVTALEPQAMYGLANYPGFKYLLLNEFFPILRVE